MKRKINTWKIISIIFIVLFVLIVVGGLLRVHNFRSSDTMASNSQIETAKNIAFTDITNRGENITGYLFKASDKIRSINTGSIRRNIIEVSVFNQSARHTYIVDINSGDILVYSKTEFNDGLDHSKDMQREFPRVFP